VPSAVAKQPRSQCWRRFHIGAHDGAARRGLSRPEGNALALEWPPPHGRGGPYLRKSMTACASSDQMISPEQTTVHIMQQSTLLCLGFHRYSQGHARSANQAATYGERVQNPLGPASDFLLPITAGFDPKRPSRSQSLDLNDHLDFNGIIERKPRHPYGRACMLSNRLAENIHHQIGKSVYHLWLVTKIVGRVDHP